MSLVEELGARLRTAADELPVPELVNAVGRLRAAVDLLSWVRQTSTRTVGVPELAQATERLEGAVAAVRVAQDEVNGYLAAIGLTHQGAPVADESWRGPMGAPVVGDGPPMPDGPGGRALDRWWVARVNALTEGEAEVDPNDPDQAAEAAHTSQDLLRRVAQRGDRAALRRELARVSPPIGLGMAAITPAVLNRLCGRLLGYVPREEDLPRLLAAVRGRVRDLLPNADDTVTAALLAQACRLPPSAAARIAPQRTDEPPHPADTAITGGVLVAALLRATGQSASAIDPEAPTPTNDRPTSAGRPTADGSADA